MSERMTGVERCPACGATAAAGAAACPACGEPTPRASGDPAAPFPRIPDGGLAESMPAWLREAPAPAAPAAAPGDAAPLVEEGDLPAWLRALAAGAPSLGGAAAETETGAAAWHASPLYLPAAPSSGAAPRRAVPEDEASAAAGAADDSLGSGAGIPWWLAPLLCAIALAVAAALWYAATGG